MDPGLATFLGEHSLDAELPDPSTVRRDARIGELEVQLSRADVIAGEPLGTSDRVDLEVLIGRLSAELIYLRDVREPDWNPLEHNPGGAIDALLSRPFAPLAQRLESVAGRVGALGEYFAAVRARLDSPPEVFVRTALLQLRGLRTMCIEQIPAAAAGTPMQSIVLQACERAVPAIDRYVDWLAAAPSNGQVEMRLGAEQFARKLRWTLGTELPPDQLLALAETELDHSIESITEAASRWARISGAGSSSVAEVLDILAMDVVDDEGILGYCRTALGEATTFVADQALLSVPDELFEIIELPEVDRGVAVAYCRSPGPLETAGLAPQFAVSPTPEDWTAERVASFYREYNVHMLHDLTVHEAMPGHAVQLIAANRGGTAVTRTWRNGAFVEGWAVYAEELMAGRGYRADVSPAAAAALVLQQLKMRIRTVINTMLDIQYHCAGLTEADAMRLMTTRGFQEDGEAAGKWRRVQLSSTQLCEYFTGYVEVQALALDLAAARAQATVAAVHDEMLAHGSPPVPQLRQLVGLGPRS